MHLVRTILIFSAVVLVNEAGNTVVDPVANKWDKVYVKWASGGETAHDNGEGYIAVPLTATDAQNAGWVLTDTGSDGDVWSPEDDPTMSILTDGSGKISGFDVSVLKAFVNETPYNFALHPIFSPGTWKGEELYKIRMTFEDPDNLEQGIRRAENLAAGLWIDGVQIPTNSSEIVETTQFVKENCVTTMGGHYYYNLTSELQCEYFEPPFLLMNATEETVIGLGIQIFGKVPNATKYENFTLYEDIPVAAVKLIAPTGPDCLTEWVAEYGILSLHIYFIDKPWTLAC